VAEGAEREAEIAQAVRMAYLGVALSGRGGAGDSGRAGRDPRRAWPARSRGWRRGWRRRCAWPAPGLARRSCESRLGRRAQRAASAWLATLRLLLGMPAGEVLELSDGFDGLGASEPPAATAGPAGADPDGRALGGDRGGAGAPAEGDAPVGAADLGSVRDRGLPVPADLRGDRQGRAGLGGWSQAELGGLRRRLARAAGRGAGRAAGRADGAAPGGRRGDRAARARRRCCIAHGDGGQCLCGCAGRGGAGLPRCSAGGESGGTATALEVRQAEEALDQARLAEIKARFDKAVAASDRLRALGVARTAGATQGGGER
jgi:hypothetical protein